MVTNHTISPLNVRFPRFRRPERVEVAIQADEHVYIKVAGPAADVLPTVTAWLETHKPVEPVAKPGTGFGK